MPYALVVQREQNMLNRVTNALAINGVSAKAVSKCSDMLNMLNKRPFCIVIADGSMKTDKGQSIVEAVRKAEPDIPLIALVSEPDEETIINGLNDGADFVLSSECTPSMLNACIHTLLRRHGYAETLAFGDIELDRSESCVIGNLGNARLTAKEFKLLDLFMHHPQQVITRSMMLERVWGYRFDPGTGIAEVALSRLRRQLASVSDQVTLRTLRNIGVVIDLNDEPKGEFGPFSSSLKP